MKNELRALNQERNFLENSSVFREEPVVKYTAIVYQVGFSR